MVLYRLTSQFITHFTRDEGRDRDQSSLLRDRESVCVIFAGRFGIREMRLVGEDSETPNSAFAPNVSYPCLLICTGWGGGRGGRRIGCTSKR